VTEISIRQAAALLNVTEKTIQRWLRQGVIPSLRDQGELRFDQAELEAWARFKRIGALAGGAQAAQGEEQVDLLPALLYGGVHHGVPGHTTTEVFQQAIPLLGFVEDKPALREELVTNLIEREALASTGLGHGLAIPHPRHPRDWGLGRPVVGVFFLEQPVDFKSLDGQPVWVLFVLICNTVKGHLKMLAQVSHLLNQAEVRDFLARRPPVAELIEFVQTHLPHK